MVKVSSSDALAILRRFGMADEGNVPRQIERLNFYHPTPISTLVEFRFLRKKYYILFDDTVEDEIDEVLKQVRTVKHDEAGEVVVNPNDHLMTYGLPFKGKSVYLFAALSGKKRLDVELAERYPDVSRSTWQKHIKADLVKVNDEVRNSPKFEVTENDIISVDRPAPTDFSAQSLPVVYIDDNVVVIDKPAGVLTHSKGAMFDEFTVAEFFRRFSTYNLDTNRPGIVHRLDRDTSGVMIGARNEETAIALQRQFADRRVKKEYLAVLSQSPKESTALIDLPIGRNPLAPSTFRVDVSGRPAQTTYEVVKSTKKACLVRLMPKTGRTHQLRVHMRYLDTPIVGDRVYGGQAAERLYLHARSLELTLPGGKRKTFVVEAPQEFDEMVK